MCLKLCKTPNSIFTTVKLAIINKIGDKNYVTKIAIISNNQQRNNYLKTGKVILKIFHRNIWISAVNRMQEA